MAGIKDVAKLAQVGVGTVSRVINESGYVSQETRKKIEEAMKQLDYTPNELARNLYRKKTGIIAVLVPTISHPFFAELVNHIEIELHQHGYKTMLCNTAQDRNMESEYLQMLRQNIVEGVITGVHSLDVQEYLNVNRPIVALDRYLSEEIPVVSVDHVRGGITAAKELMRCGCRKVVQIMGAKRVQSPAQNRHEAFEEELKRAGIEVCSYEMEWNKYDIRYFNEVTHRVYEENPDADGMFGTDLLALSYMRTAMEHGKRIPEDLKVVAYDGTDVTEMVYPSVTIIKQPIEKLAREAVRLIIREIEGKPCDKRLELEAVLMRGESTRLPLAETMESGI